MIALSNPTKQIETIGDWNRSVGSFVCFVFPYMSQAMIESSFARIENIEGSLPDTAQQLSSWSELLADSGHLALLGLRRHPCEACLWKVNFADSSKVKVGFRINLDGDAMILKPSQAERSNQHGVQHIPSKILPDLGVQATCLLASACTKATLK